MIEQNRTSAKNAPISRNDRRSISPHYSVSACNAAARRIRKALKNGSPCLPEDEKIIENRRASHTHILNTWQVILRNQAKKEDVVFVQRLKRRNTIYDKLLREPKMALTTMHDIAGCRLIFKNYDAMIDFINGLHKAPRMKHRLKRTYDYVRNPKKSGYRGVHDEYEYHSRPASDRSNLWDGLLLEIQYRTIYQHAWATAVEVAGNLTNNLTKFDKGDENQKEFFRLTSEIIARTCENQSSCYADMTDDELVRRFETLEKNIALLHRLKQLKAMKKVIIDRRNNVILHFIFNGRKEPRLEAHVFKSLASANDVYFQMEKDYPEDDIVLVRTNDDRIGKSIRDAFRNYFIDTSDYIEYVENGLKILKREILPLVPKQTGRLRNIVFRNEQYEMKF